jgi:hypothetical protein
MARILAVDWDGIEIRFVLGNLVKEKLTVLKTGSGPIEEVADEEGKLIPDIGVSLRQLLSEHRVGKNRLLVGLRRGGTEVLQFELPPATDEELPHLVKNQMLRDSPNYVEGAPVDFLAVNDDPTEQRRVTVGALTRAQLRSIIAECKKAGQRPARIELRSAEVASVLRGSQYADDAPTLLVNRVGDEADLTVLLDQKIVYLRSILLPGSLEENEIATRILAEVNRTLAVGLQEADSARAIEKVILFGSEEEQELLIDKLGDLPLELQVVHPFELSQVRAKKVPETPGRYTALLGMIFDESPLHKPAIDFLHPKETPKPPNYARWVVVGILLLIAAGTGLYFWNKNHLASLDQRVADLKEEYQQVNQEYQQAQLPFRVLSAARQWDTHGLVLLDELRDMSVRFPDQRNLVLVEMTFLAEQRGGTVTVRGMVRDPGILTRLRQSLQRDRHHMMTVDRLVRNPGGGGYPWVFQATILCQRRTGKEYLRHLSRELQQLSQQPPPFVVEQQKKQAQQKAEMLAERKKQLAARQKALEGVELPVNFDQLNEEQKQIYLQMPPQKKQEYRQWALRQQQQSQESEKEKTQATEAKKQDEEKEVDPKASEKAEKKEEKKNEPDDASGTPKMTPQQYKTLRSRLPAFLQSLPEEKKQTYMQMTPQQKEAYHQRVIQMLYKRYLQQRKQQGEKGDAQEGDASGKEAGRQEAGLTFPRFQALLQKMPRFFQTLPSEEQAAYQKLNPQQKLVYENRLLINLYLREQMPEEEREKSETMPVSEKQFQALSAKLPEYFQSLTEQQQQYYARMNPLQKRFFQIRSLLQLHQKQQKPEPKPEEKKPEPKPEPKPEEKKPEPKPEPKPEEKKPEPKPEPKPEEKKPEPKPEPKPEEKKPEPKPEPKPEEKKPEPKPEPKPEEKKPEPKS